MRDSHSQKYRSIKQYATNFYTGGAKLQELDRE